MSELTEKQWAVLSERGCEATGLAYMDAHQVMQDLMRKKISGLCIVTDDAARRALRNEKQQARKSNPDGLRRARMKRNYERETLNAEVKTES